MASTSSFTTLTEQKYDVFISFRGDDTRNNFLSHLYIALCRAKIKIFIDDDLKRGDDVSKALLRTIEKSKISIVVFSENYADSRWCLEELVRIMECHEKNAQIVIPIFLKVDPKHVRYQSGTFGQGLAKHGDHPNIQRWRDTLTKVANLSGWDSQVKSPEATLVNDIVSNILSKLSYTSLSTFDSLVGMSSHVERIDMILNRIPKEVCIIGFWGMGGIGKSTLARAFYNHVLSQFEGHYMIEHFRETYEKRGLNYLLDKLVSGLLKDENLNVGTPNLEIPFIRDRLHRMKALIVLDDVNNFQHIKPLVGRRDYLGSESIVVITSRYKQVLINSGVDEIYEVPRLKDHEALCLFAQHAFEQEDPIDDHRMKLSERAINYANGNPLALEVLGSYLRGSGNEEQESALRKLERTPNPDIHKVLRISYEDLDNEEQNIFLNIACFLNGETTDVVIRFHNTLGYSTIIGIRDLVDKSLIIVGTRHVWMHDLLQEMGRQIVREESFEDPGKRSRLWDHHEISHVLTKNTGTEAIKGISLDIDDIRSFSISPTAFERINNLQFLKIKVGLSTNLHLPQGLGYLPDQLRYLCWYRYTLTYLPSNFHGENLVQLIMPESNIVRLWNGRQNLPHLQLIDLSWSKNLIEIPDLSMATNLQQLYLHCCSRIKKFPKVSTKIIKDLNLHGTTIEEVPSSIDCLTSLINLNLGRCKRLKNLPSGIYKLKSLQFLSTSLLPKESEHLEEVDIHLRELTDNLGCLSALKLLNVSRSNFTKIPVSIKHLINLVSLDLNNCKRLQSLPQLPMNVQDIYARNCESLEVVANPLTIATGEVVASHLAKIFKLDFSYSFKLNQNARNSIIAHAELKILKGIEPIDIMFMGGDIPDWFKYKSLGSFLIAKLPENWCNSQLLSVALGVVFDIKDLDKYENNITVKFHYVVRNNIGDYTNGMGLSSILRLVTKNSIQSNHVLLMYGDPGFINQWRMKETNDAVVISIVFGDGGRSRGHCKVKKCGIHLLYRHEIEDRYRPSRIDFDFPSDSTQFFFNPSCMEEDIEETGIESDQEGDGGSNDNCCNTHSSNEEKENEKVSRKLTLKEGVSCFTWFSSCFSTIFLSSAREMLALTSRFGR